MREYIFKIVNIKIKGQNITLNQEQ